MKPMRKIPPPVYLLFTLAVMSALHFYLPVVRVLEPPHSFVGLIFIALGILLAGVSAGAFLKAGTPVIPFERSTQLVTTGFYRITRNPMYLGLLLLLIGAAMLFGTLGAFVPIPVFVWIIQTQFIVGEERFLEEIFGEEYLAYKRRVRRWF